MSGNIATTRFLADIFVIEIFELRSQADEHGWIVGQVCVVAVVDVLWIVNLPAHEAEEATQDQVPVSRCVKTTTATAVWAENDLFQTFDRINAHT